MSGGRDPVGGDVWVTDNRIGTLLSGATERTVIVQGVWVGDGGGIFGKA